MTHKEILEEFFDLFGGYSYPYGRTGEVKLFFSFADGRMTLKECEDTLQQYYSDKYDNMLGVY